MYLRSRNELRATVDRCVDGWALLLLLALCLVAPASIADQIIPVGGRTVVSNGLFDLACTDLSVAGVLDTGSGMYVNVRNVTVAPSGIIQGGGSIHYSGTLTINGTVQPGVRLIVNPPSNLTCPGPRAEVIPTLGHSMIAVLALLLLWLASLAARVQETRSGRRESK